MRRESMHQGLKPQPLQIKEGRFARLEAIEWWDQRLLARTKVLVIGAGALGNEVIKNLALLGIGHVVVADMDLVELSNLSRSVLFRESDEGVAKAECAARAARGLFEGMEVKAFVGNILSSLGLGYFRWADVVIGALDNREARVFVNAACAQVGRPWFDGGIEVLHGVIRGFAPPGTACYECTMSKVDWDLLNKRRSCSLLARRAIAQRGTPTTPTTASIIAALQVQEVIKYLHGMDGLVGRGFIFDGASHTSYAVNYPIDPGCPWHEAPAPVESVVNLDSSGTLSQLWGIGEERLGGLDALDLAREVVNEAICQSCGDREVVLLPAENVRADQLRCANCGTERVPEFFHSITRESPLLRKSIREIGLPAWDIVWARRGKQLLGLEISGDDPFVPAEHRKGTNGV